MKSRGFIPVIALIVLVIFLSSLAFAMSTKGTVTITERAFVSPYKVLVFNWVSSATEGAISDWTTNAYSGKIHSLISTPSTGDASPSVFYDIFLYDQYGNDLLRNNGCNRSQTATEVVQDSSTVAGAGFIPLVNDKFYLSVQRCGNARSGTATVYIEP